MRSVTVVGCFISGSVMFMLCCHGSRAIEEQQLLFQPSLLFFTFCQSPRLKWLWLSHMDICSSELQI